MVKGVKKTSDILDEMALKVLMIEPGDLSVVGELLELVEQLVGISSKEVEVGPVLAEMGSSFNAALEKIIMGELKDSAENFGFLGRCISQIQEIVRKNQAEAKDIKIFNDNLAAVGFRVGSDLPGGGDVAKEGEASLSKPAGGKSAIADVPDFLQDKELLAGFIEETFEHLESIEVNILDLEHSPDDEEIINNIFRPFHTIKGVSGFLNLKLINELAHTTENLLDDVRNGKRAMDSDVIDVVLSVGDFLRSMVQNIKDVLEKGAEYYQEFDISEYVTLVRTLQEGGSPVRSTAVKTVPPAPQQVLPLGDDEADDEVDEANEDDFVEEQVLASTVKAVVGPADGSRLSTSKVFAGADQSEAPAGPISRNRLGASIKVDIEKLDGLVNAVGELVIMQTMVQQNPLVSKLADPKLTKDFSQLSRITSELQKTAMAMRMVPIRQTFQKMIRLVRDLSKKSGKLVDLVMIGEETEIDRNMVDSIYDPLVHMIRNSVDHGVQVPAEREAVGKSPTGTVKLSAYQKGGYIVIEIEDDGQGLNTEKVRQKAIERGLIKEDDHLTDKELNNLVFLPGFSTADKITDVSGRGVGMDVVKKAVEKLRGKVEVISQPGEGSQCVIRLPLTLAIIDGIIVRVGAERYIIPTIAIQESIRPTPNFYNTVHGKGETLTIRNRLVPIIRLNEVFGVVAEYEDPFEAIVVVVEYEGRQRALMVDELLGKQEVVIKSLGGYMKDIKGVAGGTILGDGRVGLILDLAGLIAVSESSVPVEEKEEEVITGNKD
ncbi:MAG: chemotaxis protein CheA [Proteobacteria bacterium]|nr:chemotaxis protein CheA [Pseudomonadota bacterium]MBU1715814.1 chemotaxis protein CheA [Pseudomonadota bacterium]